MQTASLYLLEQKSETTDPEKHFLEEGGKGLDLAEERLWLRSQAQQAPTQGEGHGSRLCTGPTAHLPGSGIWRLPLLSTSSRGGRGCPASASTGQKVGVLKHMGGHRSASPRYATSGAPVLEEDRHWCPSISRSQDTRRFWLRLSQGWYNPVPKLEGLKLYE